MSNVTEDEFRQMCQNHDLTFDYSDDHGVWERGNANLKKIEQAAKTLPEGVASRIWNEVVDTKLVPNARAQFYWKV